MRPSSKTTILRAALRLAERHGITSLTLEATAAEAGLSKGGLIYHFASKEQLIRGVVDHITEQWHEAMRGFLGKPFDEATPAERLAAYTRAVVSDTTSRASLIMLVDALHDERLLAPWQELVQAWTSPPPSNPDPVEVDRAVARLAVDGLWVSEAIGTTGFDEAARAAVVARIDELATAEATTDATGEDA